MRELTLKDMQQKGLDILSDVHDFCVKHDIKYSLAYGSLIGAIRHKGFIPWDDDVDIIMPRPDYEKFCSSFSAPGRGLIRDTDKDSYILFSRVFDTEGTICRTMNPFAKKYSGGVWIDIFPLDGVSDDFNSFSETIRSLKLLWQRQIRYRYADASVKEILQTFPIKDILILFALKITGTSGWFLKKNNRKMRQLASRFKYGETGHWSQLTVLDDSTRNYRTMDLFRDTIDVAFEDKCFKALSGYDQYLRNIYGDYMQLPPEKDRKPKQHRLKFYWKYNIQPYRPL